MSNDVIFQEQLQTHSLLDFLSTFKSSWTLPLTQTGAVWIKLLLVWFAFSITGDHGTVTVGLCWFRRTLGSKQAPQASQEHLLSTSPSHVSKVCCWQECCQNSHLPLPCAQQLPVVNPLQRGVETQTKSGTESWKKIPLGVAWQREVPAAAPAYFRLNSARGNCVWFGWTPPRAWLPAAVGKRSSPGPPALLRCNADWFPWPTLAHLPAAGADGCCLETPMWDQSSYFRKEVCQGMLLLIDILFLILSPFEGYREVWEIHLQNCVGWFILEW